MKPYTDSINSEGKYYVNGPGEGFSFYSGWVFPNFQCQTSEEAIRAAEMCNAAYQEGYKQAQRDIQKAIGCT